MQETCKVVKVKKGKAFIEVERNEKCAGCKACNFGKNNVITLPAIMETEVKEGDFAVVEMPTKDSSFIPLIIFGIPLLMFLLGLGIGLVTKEDYMMIILGFSFFAVGILAGFFIDRMLRQRPDYAPVIKERIHKDLINNAEDKIDNDRP